MYSLKVIEDNFKEVLSAIPAARKNYLYSPLAIQYEKEYFENRLVPSAIVLSKDNIPLGIMFYTLDSVEGFFSFFRRPVTIFWSDLITSDDQFELFQLLINTLEKKIEKKEIKKILISFDSVLFSSLQKYSPALLSDYEAVIDLNYSDENIKRGIRKRYRPLINWGKKELVTTLIDNKNFSEEMFRKFQQFHLQVAGRETRLKSTWDLQLEMIRNGEAFLLLGFYHEQLVSGVLVFLGFEEAYYAVGVNDRTLMAEKLPIGHSLMLDSILLTKKLGLKKFNIGKVGPSFSNDKERDIGNFKKGFSSAVELSSFFEVNIEDQ